MLALSQIWHLCHVFTLPKWAVTRINKAIWSFFWSGKRDLVARKVVSLSKSRGGFGVIDVELKAEAFILQWVKRYFQPSRAKWKDLFNSTFSSCLRVQAGEVFTQPSSAFTRCQLKSLPSLYAKLMEAWGMLGGGSVEGVTSLDVSSGSPLLVEHMSGRNTYLLRQTRLGVQPHCVAKFDAHYGPLPWPQIWGQLHVCPYDRLVTDLNWQIAHGVLYTGARLGTRFRIASVDPRCFCGTDDETLEHLFFECELARQLVSWVQDKLRQIEPQAASFTVTELLFGFTPARRRVIPSIIIWMLQVMKHAVWVARCDFRFRQTAPQAALCVKKVIAKIKFLLNLSAHQCNAAQCRSFERELLGCGSLGKFQGEELVFSF